MGIAQGLPASQRCLSSGLRAAHSALCGVASPEQALYLLGRLVLGLVARGRAYTAWQDPEAALTSAWSDSHVVLPPCRWDSELEGSLLRNTSLWPGIASALAPLDLAAIDSDVLGPLYAIGLTRRQRRARGVYFTPPQLVDLVLDRAGVLRQDALADGNGGILDPAAGTGAFLVRALARARQAGGYGAVARLLSRVQAVEISPAACALLRLNLAIQWAIACDGQPLPLPPVRVAEGDALLAYSDFLPGSDPRISGVRHQPTRPDDALAAVAADASFSFVLGNPPYMGESGNRELFAAYRTHPFWGRYSESKMDFLQYFLVLGLSKIQQREGARLCFLTSAYWLTADGAQGLRDLVLSQALVREVILLGGARLFPDAPGHESAVVLLERCSSPTIRRQARPRVASLRSAGSSADMAPLVSRALDGISDDSILVRQHPQEQAALLGQPWFFSVTARDLPLLERLDALPPLSMSYAARQGVAPGAQRVDRAALKIMGPQWVAEHDVVMGEGVFVLTTEEAAALRLPAAETRFVRPFVKNSNIERYAIDDTKPLWLIYLHHDEVREESECPRLAAHLARFRPLLTRKREFQQGRREWFHLHWPRDEALFEGKKVMTAHRKGRPAFAWSGVPLYAATDVYYLVHRYPRRPGPLSLAALTGILNSAMGWFWLYHRTKAKGEQREFFSKALERFPLPDLAGCGDAGRILAELERSVMGLQALYQSGSTSTAQAERAQHLEAGVDDAVFALYGLDAASRADVRQWGYLAGGDVGIAPNRRRPQVSFSLPHEKKVEQDQ